MRRLPSVLLVLTFLLDVSDPAWGRGFWKTRIDSLAAGRSIGIAVREEGRFLYRHRSKKRRIPASNQKLLMTMALFDSINPRQRFAINAASTVTPSPVLQGDLWILGHGDPSVTGGGRFGRRLPFEPTRLGALARSVRDAGIAAIEGRVMGNTGYFAHDWYAPGWKRNFARRYVALPSALSFEGNTHKGKHISDPELRAASSLTRKLEHLGVRIEGEPGAAQAPAGLTTIATVRSPGVAVMARYMNRRSSNFFAEVLGKRLGVEWGGIPGTIAKGAAAVAGWAARLGIRLVAHDASGLSYENRVAPSGIVRLLGYAEDRAWGDSLRRILPAAGQGTLENRFNGVRLHAKTGTLDQVSSLSGYVWLRRRDTWAEFSILSRGMPKWFAAGLEEEIVRILTRHAR